MAHALWKGTINFGLVALPVELVVADVSKDIHFNMLDSRDMAPIHFKRFNAVTNKEVTWKNIVKGYKTDSGEYVIITDADFKKANVRATQAIDILGFVDLAKVDVTYFEKPYYVKPTKGGEKPYKLLLDTLKETEKVGMATVVIRTKQHLAALIVKDNHLVLELMRFPDEIRDIKDVEIPPVKAKVTARELKMAKDLVASMSSDWNPEEYKDTYHDDIMKMIHYKIKHGDTESIPESEAEDDAEGGGSVIDLMPLLRKSLDKKSSSASGLAPKATKKKVKRGSAKVS